MPDPVPDPAPAGPALWRGALRLPGPAMPDLLDALDEVADTVSLFEEEDPRTGETTAWRVELFFRAQPDRRLVTAALAAVVGAQAAGRLAIAPVPATDWVVAAAMQIEPVAVGRFFVHGAKDAGRAPAGAVPILLEAGLAFGSGDHATTRACLAAIDDLDREHRWRRVLDMGCGSGILAIAAAKLQPCEALAVDLDAVAVRVAAENIAQNGLAASVQALEADGYDHPRLRAAAPFDLVLANILAGPLIAFAPALAAHLAPGGHAVLSGLLDRQADAVVAAHEAAGLTLTGRIDEGPWMGLIVGRPG